MEDSLRAHAEQRVGTVIKNKYRVDQVLGMGGMAVVYAVTHTRNNAELALKMLHPELSFREDIRQRFLREGYAANSVKHASVVKVVDDDTTEDGAAFIVMEMLHGAGVDTLWEKHDGKLPIPVALAIVDQLLDVLRAAHEKGIVHRDIKPANLFLTRDGIVKVLDFGIARVRDALASGSAAQTGTGVLMGTPAFMSPEQALAKTNEVDAQSDVWAAGATIFTLISAHFVHEAESGPQMLVNAATKPAPSITTVVPGVPPPVVDLIARALAFDKAGRYPSASAMRDALRAAHRAAYGTLPSRDALEALFTDLGSASTQFSQSAPAAPLPPFGIESRPAPAPAPSPGAHTGMPALRIGGTTAQPISSDAIPSRDPVPKASRVPLFAAGVAVAMVLLGVGVYAGKVRSSAATAPEPPTTTLTSASAPPPATPTATEIPSATIEASPSSGPSTRPSATVAASARPTASAKLAATASATANCDPPFFFDQVGKHWKPECL